MTIESNNQKFNLTEVKGVSISPTADGVSAPKAPDHLLDKKPTTIFEGMTKNDAEFYGLMDEYTAANTDGEDGITKEEFDNYQAKKSAENTPEADADTTEDGMVDVEAHKQTLRAMTQKAEEAEATTPVLLTKIDVLQIREIPTQPIDIKQKLKPVKITSQSGVMTYSRNLLSAGMSKDKLLKIQEHLETMGESEFKKAQINDVINMFDEADSDGDGKLSAEESATYLNSTSHKITEHVKKQLKITAKDAISTTSKSGTRTLNNAEYINTDSFGNEITDPDKEMEEAGINLILSDKRRLKSGTYIVQEGDTLADIAEDFNISLIQLCINNKDVLGGNTTPKPGTKLAISGYQTSAKNKNRLEFESQILGVISAEGTPQSKIPQIAQIMQKYSEPPKIFVGMTEEQAIQAGVEDLWQLYSCGLGQITQAGFAEYQKTITPIDNSDVLALIKTAIGEELDLSDFKMFKDTLLPMLMDCSGADRNSKAYKDAASTVQNTIDNLDGLTIEQIGDKSKELMNTLTDKAKNEIVKHGETYTGHMARLKKGDFNQFEMKQGLRKGVELTEEQLEYYAQAATKAEYILPVIDAIGNAIDNKDDKKIVALVAHLGTEFFNLPDVILVVQAYALENVCDKLKAKLAAMIAQNAITEGASEASQALLGSVIASTGNVEAFEEFSQKVHGSFENFDDYIEIVQAAISNMPEETQEILKEVLNNAKTSAPSETPASTNQGTTSGGVQGGSASGSYSSAQNSQDYNGLPVGSYNNSVSDGMEATKTQSHEFMDNRGITDITAEQQTVNQVSLKLKNEMAIQQKLRYAQARIKNMSKSKVFELVAKHFDQIPDQYKEQVENYFKQMPTQLLVETMIGNEDIQNFMFKHKFVKFDDLVTYVRKHPHLVSSGNKEMSDSLKEKLQEYVEDNKIKDLRVETSTT